MFKKSIQFVKVNIENNFPELTCTISKKAGSVFIEIISPKLKPRNNSKRGIFGLNYEVFRPRRLLVNENT